ncbi:MAG: Lin0512 family protein [Candidatus Azotimanducaceae bacterium]
MNKVRYLTEMGMGVDVHGGDYTKAACRAVSDALRHSSLNFFKPLKKSHSDMHITVKIGVAKPNLVDCATVAKEVPYGTVTVEASIGGLNIEADDESDELVIASAGILVHFEE